MVKSRSELRRLKLAAVAEPRKSPQRRNSPQTLNENKIRQENGNDDSRPQEHLKEVDEGTTNVAPVIQAVAVDEDERQQIFDEARNALVRESVSAVVVEKISKNKQLSGRGVAAIGCFLTLSVVSLIVGLLVRKNGIGEVELPLGESIVTAEVSFFFRSWGPLETLTETDLITLQNATYAFVSDRLFDDPLFSNATDFSAHLDFETVEYNITLEDYAIHQFLSQTEDPPDHSDLKVDFYFKVRFDETSPVESIPGQRDFVNSVLFRVLGGQYLNTYLHPHAPFEQLNGILAESPQCEDCFVNVPYQFSGVQLSNITLSVTVPNTTRSPTSQEEFLLAESLNDLFSTELLNKDLGTKNIFEEANFFSAGSSFLQGNETTNSKVEVFFPVVYFVFQFKAGPNPSKDKMYQAMVDNFHPRFISNYLTLISDAYGAAGPFDSALEANLMYSSCTYNCAIGHIASSDAPQVSDEMNLKTIRAKDVSPRYVVSPDTTLPSMSDAYQLRNLSLEYLNENMQGSQFPVFANFVSLDFDLDTFYFEADENDTLELVLELVQVKFTFLTKLQDLPMRRYPLFTAIHNLYNLDMKNVRNVIGTAESLSITAGDLGVRLSSQVRWLLTGCKQPLSIGTMERLLDIIAYHVKDGLSQDLIDWRDLRFDVGDSIGYDAESQTASFEWINVMFLFDDKTIGLLPDEKAFLTIMKAALNTNGFVDEFRALGFEMLVLLD